MFKKKQSLPARPSIPIKDEIMEDLTCATSDDTIYKYPEVNIPGESVIPEKKDNLHAVNKLDPKDPFYSYNMITVYVEKVENLMEHKEKIRNSINNLQQLKDSLLEDMVKVKSELKKQIATPEAISENLR